ncbi:MAG TPA: hypothetical protein VGI96_15435 [Streptosporangiaceae bacterium]
MSDGSQEALAGMLTGPFAHASQTPLTSVRPLRERTIRRHSTFSGSPRTCSWMLVPHDIAVRAAVALTCVAASAPLTFSAVAAGPAAPEENRNPPPAPTARQAAAAAQPALVPRRTRARLGGRAGLGAPARFGRWLAGQAMGSHPGCSPGCP